MQRHHNTADMPPSRWSYKAGHQGWGMTAVPYLSARARYDAQGRDGTTTPRRKIWTVDDGGL
jgi:hypothetical protein